MIIQELSNALYESSPYLSTNESYVDHGYPHTNILPDLLEVLFKTLKPIYIVECGSMLGNSAIIMAQVLKSINDESEIICIDPFTGDVNMWDWERKASWKFLRLENGVPTIYKRFLANCKHSGFEKKILPINATTSVGIKLLQRLFSQKRISAMPNYIYLDSAHEEHETFIELLLCWNALQHNSIIFGDDWGWVSVRNDVIKFSQNIKNITNYSLLHDINKRLFGSEIYNDTILLYKGQWMMFKM